jgi:IrrE N-terminal-like domain
LGRGFVADSERIASSIRAELGIGPTAKLPLELAAKIYGARVVSAANLVDMSRLVELERIQAFAFSACTFDVDGIPVIVFNPLRSEPRRQSDVAHELSHLILKHDLSEIREVAGLPFRTCRADQEEEATALGGASTAAASGDFPGYERRRDRPDVRRHGRNGAIPSQHNGGLTARYNALVHGARPNASDR